MQAAQEVLLTGVPYVQNVSGISKRQKMIEGITDNKKNSELTPSERVYLARLAERPKIGDYTAALFTDFFECRGCQSR